jgi:WD40 repeat protein
VDKTTQGDSLARWFATAAYRLPRVARETRAYSSLAFTVSNLFGLYSPAEGDFPGPLLPPQTERVSLWGGLRAGGLSLAPHPAEGYVEIEVPRTKPILLEVRRASEAPQLLRLAWGESVIVGAEGEVEVRTLAGDSYRFFPDLESAKGHAESVLGVQISADGRRAVSASYDETLKVWDTDSGAELRTLEGHSDAVNWVALSEDGRRAVSASDDYTLKVWDTDSGAELRTLESHSSSVNGVALSADGHRAVSASYDHTLKVWDTNSGRELRMLEGHWDSVRGVALSADGRRAVSSSADHTLKVWDTDSGAELRTLEGHSDAVYGVALSADGRRAVSASDDHTLKVWDLDAGKVIATFTCDAGAVCCAWSRSGVIVAGDRLGRVHFLTLVL